MITAVSLNPSVDMTLSIDGFIYGGLNRTLSERYDAGGKGMNVALAAARLGVPAECLGFMREESARMFEEKLQENGAGCEFVYLPGRTRTNIKLRDEKTECITEINQAGSPVTENDLVRLEALVAKRAMPGGYMVFSGSLPPGCPTDYYGTLIEVASRKGCRCVLDADGARLTEGIRAKPFLVKPNRYELELLTGKELISISDICAAAQEIQDRGVSVVAVSLGAEGAFIADQTDAFFARALNISVGSTVGAGDSMVAALTAGFHMGKSLEDAFRMGMACSAAACMTEGTRTFEIPAYDKLLPQVAIERA